MDIDIHMFGRTIPEGVNKSKSLDSGGFIQEPQRSKSHSIDHKENLLLKQNIRISLCSASAASFLRDRVRSLDNGAFIQESQMSKKHSIDHKRNLLLKQNIRISLRSALAVSFLCDRLYGFCWTRGPWRIADSSRNLAVSSSQSTNHKENLLLK